MTNRYKIGDTIKVIYSDFSSIIGFIKNRKIKKNNYHYKIINTDKKYTQNIYFCSIGKNYKDENLYTCRLVLIEKINQNFNVKY